MTSSSANLPEAASEVGANDDRLRGLLTRLNDVEQEALGDLLARYGVEFLDRDIPYLLVAVRNRSRDAARREIRGRELEQLVPAPLDTLDPARIISGRTELQAVMSRLSELPTEDQFALWWHAAGHTDEEIVAMWGDAGFTSPPPSLNALRQRRHRTRELLRQAVGSD